MKRLPEDIAKAIANTAPTNENELYNRLKAISRYYKNNDIEVITVQKVEMKSTKGKKEKDPTESFSTELANALCCALEERSINVISRGGTLRETLILNIEEDKEERNTLEGIFLEEISTEEIITEEILTQEDIVEVTSKDEDTIEHIIEARTMVIFIKGMNNKETHQRTILGIETEDN